MFILHFFFLLSFEQSSIPLLKVNFHTICLLSLRKCLLPIFLEKLSSAFVLFVHYSFSITWGNFYAILACYLFSQFLQIFMLFLYTIYFLLPREFHLLTLERLLEVLFFQIPFLLPLYFVHALSFHAIHSLLPRNFHLLILERLVLAEVFFPLNTFLIATLFWTSFLEVLLPWFSFIHAPACCSYFLRCISYISHLYFLPTSFGHLFSSAIVSFSLLFLHLPISSDNIFFLSGFFLRAFYRLIFLSLRICPKTDSLAFFESKAQPFIILIVTHLIAPSIFFSCYF